MIKKETIIKSGVCYWSDADGCFVVESPLFTRTAGIGGSPKEAREHFRHMIDTAYEDLKAQRIAGLNKSGRPSQKGLPLSCKVQPDTFASIKKLAEELDISQGETVDLIMFFYCVRSGEQPDVPKYDQIMQRPTAIEKQVRTDGASVRESRTGKYVSSTARRKGKKTASRTDGSADPKRTRGRA